MRTILTIWTQPRKTFEYLDNHEGIDPEVNLNVLYYLGALSMMIPGIPSAISKYEISQEPLAYLIIITLTGAIIGAFFGMALLKYVQSYVLWKVGKVLEGKASKSQVQMVIAYSLIPGLISLLLSLVLLVVALIKQDINIVGYQNPLTVFLIWIFGFRTLIFGLARFNRFSYVYALINVLLVISLFQGIIWGLRYWMQ